MIDEVKAGPELVSQTLADRLVATLDDRPFTPTAAQLAWVDGGDLIAGRENGRLARIVAGRYAALVADHVIGDVSVEGAPGAYLRIMECAREAFLQSRAASGVRDIAPPRQVAPPPARATADRDAVVHVH